MTIDYFGDNSIDVSEDVLIMGEFNQWMPDVMQRLEGNHFTYQIDVIPGFKYRYQFIVNGEITIDYN